MSAVEKIRKWYRDRLKKARQRFEDRKTDLKKERDERIDKARKPDGPTVMYDSVDVSRIPANAEAVAGYVNGIFTTWPEIQRRFPKAKKLSIAVTSSANAECLDIEPGNATPKDGPAWVKRQKARGVKRPVVYANVSTMPTVLAELARAGISRNEVRVWTAHYGKGKHICGPQCGFGMKTVADGTQWIEDKSRNLDINELKPDFFS